MFIAVYCSTKCTTLYLPWVLGLVGSHPSEASPSPTSTAVHGNSISLALLTPRSLPLQRPPGLVVLVTLTAMGEIFWRETSLPPSLPRLRQHNTNITHPANSVRLTDTKPKGFFIKDLLASHFVLSYSSVEH